MLVFGKESMAHFLVVTLSACAVILMSAAAAAEPVEVVAIDGILEYRHDDTQAWQPVSRGLTLPIPVELRSGADSSARVSQSGTSFDISADSRITLTNDDNNPDGLVSRVKQWLGTVFYDVERQPDTFSVETAFLVATVKGTQFNIVATEDSSFVTLKEGRLEVVDLKSSAVRILEAGGIVRVSGDLAGIDYLQQTPDALSISEQQLALDLSSDTNSLNLGLTLDDGLGSTVGLDLGDDLGVELGADVGDELGVGVGVDAGGDLIAGIGSDGSDDLGADLGVDVGLGDDLDADLGVGIDDGLDGDLGVDIGDGLDVDLDAGLNPPL